MGWLEKNKDPLNDSVVDLLRKSTDPTIASLFADHQSEGKLKSGMVSIFVILQEATIGT